MYDANLAQGRPQLQGLTLGEGAGRGEFVWKLKERARALVVESRVYGAFVIDA